MNILFLTMGRFDSIESHSIYADLLRCFRNHRHEIYAIAPNERKTGKETVIEHEMGAHVLHVETGDVTGASNLIQKGLAQISIETIYIKAIKGYFNNVKFDLVMYSTPPITFSRVVEFVKKRDRANSYLLLKDIFPQNAVDIGMLSTSGLKGLIYKYFRKKEKKLYRISNYIGCMSQANVDYVLKNNSEIDASCVEICPNSIEPIDRSVSENERLVMRRKYGIPIDKTVFVYGGNLGKPQGIPFIIECLKSQRDKREVFFLIVGGGTEYRKLEEFVQMYRLENVKLMKRLPKEDYDAMVGSCDVGMIFLDYRFTIPNFPSRLLSYIQAKLPVLAATDPNTAIGKTIVEAGFGWWCESNSTEEFSKRIEEACAADRKTMGKKAWDYLNKNYSAEISCTTILRHFLS